MLPDVPVDGTIWTAGFWKAAAERAIRTGAVAASLVLIGDAYESLQVNAFAVDWMRMLGFFLGGMLLSVLMSVGANAKHGRGPDFVPMEQAPRRVLVEIPEEGEEDS